MRLLGHRIRLAPVLCAALFLLTPPRGNTPQFGFDTLYAQWNGPDVFPMKVTLGRQSLALGSSFLIGDGVYDGFHQDFMQTVWHNPRRSFDAARIEFDAASLRVDSFIYRMHPTWDGGGERNGWLGGAQVSRKFARLKGSYAAGLFYRNSRSSLDNDMWVVTVRGEQPLKGHEDFYLSGEWAGEFGRGRNAAYVTTPGQDLSEHAFHAEAGWLGSQAKLKPFVEAGFVRYSRDFTPIATGFSDWGKWYLGNQIDWIVFGTDTRILRAQAGFWPRETVKLRAQYHRTGLVSAAGVLAEEVSLIGEWTASERVWVNVAVGYSTPRAGLARSGLGNSFAFLNQGAVPVGKKASTDIVIAFGFNLGSVNP